MRDNKYYNQYPPWYKFWDVRSGPVGGFLFGLAVMGVAAAVILVVI